MSDDKPNMQNRVDLLKKELRDKYGLDHHIEHPGALWPGHNPLAKSNPVAPATQCLHKTRHSFKKYNKHDTHTLQCCKGAHDDAAHEWVDPTTGRTVIWFNDGPPPDIDY